MRAFKKKDSTDLSKESNNLDEMDTSDFHLDKETSEDATNHIINPLLNSIGKYHPQKGFDLILFTGDLVSKGGKSYGDLKTALKAFEQIFIEPILSKTGLSKDRFYFIPGNHDIDRNADSKITEAGLEQILKTGEDVNNLIRKPEGISRIIPFKEFEKSFYPESLPIEKSQTDFQSSYKINIDGRKIGIACLNSAWRSYDSKADKGKIFIGEKQLTDSTNFLKDCEIKIVLSHHHYDWLNNVDTEIISTLLNTSTFISVDILIGLALHFMRIQTVSYLLSVHREFFPLGQ